MAFENITRLVNNAVTAFRTVTDQSTNDLGETVTTTRVESYVDYVQQLVTDTVWVPDPIETEESVELIEESEVEAIEEDVEISSLATEVYEDEEAVNCLDVACETLAELEAQGVDISQYQVVIMANRDPEAPGHAGILGPDGTFYDQAGAHDYDAFLAEHPELEVLTDASGELPRGDVVLDALNLPPGRERDAALEAAGLADIANTQVAFPPLLILGAAALAAVVLAGCSGDPVDMDYASIEARVLDGLNNGVTTDEFRDEIARDFNALDMAESEQLMTAIRNAGLLDEFLDATLRDPNGDPVDPVVRTTAETMLNTGRLGFMGGTFASNGIATFSPSAGETTPSGDTRSHYVSDNVYLNVDTITVMHETMTHEMYHAFSADHGQVGGSAFDEGFGIAIIDYAFGTGSYDVAERVYGTANFYHDQGNTGYPMGGTTGYDPLLMEVVTAIAAGDTSGLAWNDPVQLQNDYTNYFEALDRFADADLDGNLDWFQVGHADSYFEALAQMHADRAAAGTP